MNTNSRSKGNTTENIAIQYLQKANYTILKHNFNTRAGEIDVIAHDNEMLVFIEVKSLSINSHFSVYETLTQKKKRSLLYAINTWLREKNLQHKPWRCDLICIVLGGDTPYSLEHFSYIQLEKD